MVENYKNSDNINNNSSIEIKKTLKRTIIQLEKAINIINQQSIKDLPNLTIVEKLLNSSNALVDYLQFRNSPKEKEENLDDKKINNEEDFKEITIDKPTNKPRKKDKTQGNNFILIIVLIISLFSNVLIWWFKPNTVINVSENRENNSQIESNHNEINSQNIPIIDNTNILIKDNNEEDNNISNNINSLEIINDKPKENIAENKDKVIDNKDKVIDNNNTSTENISNENDSDIEDYLSLPLTANQSLLQNIQTQIADITNKYEKKLIIKIDANFGNNSLIITLNQNWYSLSNSEQYNLVKDIFDQVKTLNFYKFNIQNINGELLARNAVVGNEFIIIN